jgi:hypothetical protein
MVPLVGWEQGLFRVEDCKVFDSHGRRSHSPAAPRLPSDAPPPLPDRTIAMNRLGIVAAALLVALPSSGAEAYAWLFLLRHHGPDQPLFVEAT